MTGVLRIGTMEHTVTRNMTRSHMGGDDDCPQACGHRMKIPDRKVTQILMEILVRKEWIWWKEIARMVITSSDRAALVHEDGQVTMEDGLYVWEALSRAEEVELPAGRGRFRTSQLSQEQSTGERRSGQATPAVQRRSVPRMLLLGLNSSK